MISNNPQPDEVDFELAIKTYKEICEIAKGTGVTPLIETNGVLANSEKMKEFMEKANCENGGVLWDIHHPYRYFNEDVKTTFNNLSKYIKYIHIKDSIGLPDYVEYKMLGYGDVPVLDAILLLKDNNFDSYVCLEWVKRWNPNMEDAGIVFPQFIYFLKRNKLI